MGLLQTLTLREVIDALNKIPDYERPSKESQAEVAVVLMSIIQTCQDMPEISDEDWLAIKGQVRPMALLGVTQVLAEAMK